MAIAVTFFILVMLLWTYFIWSRRKYYKTALKMPRVWGLPFIGIAHEFLDQAEILKVFPKLAKEHKTKTYFTWLGVNPVIYTKDPEFIEFVLTSPHAIDKALFYDQFVNIIGDGLFTCKTEQWHKTRKLLSPSFNHKLLLTFFPNLNLISRGLCDDLEQAVACPSSNVQRLVYKMALKSSVASTMGLDFKHLNNPEFMDSLEKLLSIGSERLFKPWFRIDAIHRLSSSYKPFVESKAKVMGFVEELVAEKMRIHKKQKLKENNNTDPGLPEDSLDVKRAKQIFIEQVISLGFSFEEAVIESNFMVVAAFETTATSLFSILMCLAMHPQFQEKVYEELCTVLPDKESDVTYEDIENLVYMDMCLNESLRVVGVVPLIARSFSKDVQVSKDLVIPEGTNVVVDIFNTQRDEDIWGSDAKSFNPDHFLPANFADKPKYAFLPFSKGPRNCLGWRYARMILKVAMANALRKYRFSTNFRFEDLTFVQYITLRYDKVPNLRVHRR